MTLSIQIDGLVLHVLDFQLNKANATSNLRATINNLYNGKKLGTFPPKQTNFELRLSEIHQVFYCSLVK